MYQPSSQTEPIILPVLSRGRHCVQHATVQFPTDAAATPGWTFWIGGQLSHSCRRASPRNAVGPRPPTALVARTRATSACVSRDSRKRVIRIRARLCQASRLILQDVIQIRFGDLCEIAPLERVEACLNLRSKALSLSVSSRRFC